MSKHNLNQVTFGTAIRAPEDIKAANLEEVIGDIRDGRWKRSVEKIRNTNNEELAKAIKTGLPYFIYGKFNGKRSNDRPVEMNGAVLDYDHVKDIQGFKTLVKSFLPYVRYAFQSPRDGVKLVVTFDRPVTDEDEYRAIFAQLKAETDARLNHEKHENETVVLPSGRSEKDGKALPKEQNRVNAELQTTHRVGTRPLRHIPEFEFAS